MEQWAGAPVQTKIALAALGVSLAVSVVTGLRSRRVLNAVTYPALLLSTVCVLGLGGLALLLECALGALIWMGAARIRGRPPPRTIPYALAIAAGVTWAFLSGIELF